MRPDGDELPIERNEAWKSLKLVYWTIEALIAVATVVWLLSYFFS